MNILELIFRTNQTLLQQMSLSAWVNDQQARADKVFKLRDYIDGRHDAKITPEMRAMLQISSEFDEFNDNYCPVVVGSMANRLTVNTVTTDNDLATKWVQDIMYLNRFDGLQINVHDAALTDGDTYVLIDVDPVTQRPRFTHEPAWDGQRGMVVLYSQGRIAAAVKLWSLVQETTVDRTTATQNTYTRVNVYYPDRVERWITDGSSRLTAYDADGKPSTIAWVDRQGKPIGVPVVAFRNRRRNGDDYGLSEIENMIPLQNILNRLLYDMVATAQLTGFPIFVSKGFEAPSQLTPGAIIQIAKDGLGKDDVVDFSAVAASTPVAFIDTAKWIVGEIGRITQTPSTEFLGGVQESGEALKERQSGLTAKIKRFQVANGNAWEDVLAIAHRVQQAFPANGQPPVYERLDCQWRDAEPRNDKVVIENAMMLKELVSEAELLRMVAPVFGWDENRIQQILTEKREQAALSLSALGNTYPDFAEFDTGAVSVTDTVIGDTVTSPTVS